MDWRLLRGADDNDAGNLCQKVCCVMVLIHRCVICAFGVVVESRNKLEAMKPPVFAIVFRPFSVTNRVYIKRFLSQRLTGMFLSETECITRRESKKWIRTFGRRLLASSRYLDAMPLLPRYSCVYAYRQRFTARFVSIDEQIESNMTIAVDEESKGVRTSQKRKKRSED